MPPTDSAQPPRHLSLAGAYNVRDIGGYTPANGRTTRWHTLFRADRRHRLSVQAQQMPLAHGVRTVFELQRRHETQPRSMYSLALWGNRGLRAHCGSARG